MGEEIEECSAFYAVAVEFGEIDGELLEVAGDVDDDLGTSFAKVLDGLPVHAASRRIVDNDERLRELYPFEIFRIEAHRAVVRHFVGLEISLHRLNTLLEGLYHRHFLEEIGVDDPEGAYSVVEVEEVCARCG